MSDALDSEVRDSDVLGDPGRLAVLEATGLVDDSTAHPIPTLDRVARLVARALRTPVAQVNVVTNRAQVPTAAFVHDATAEPGGAWRTAVPLDASYCQHVVRSRAALVVEHAAGHPLVGDNRATREAGIGAYVGMPVVAPTGDVLGSVCAVDFVARRWTASDITLLEECAGLAGDEIAARLGVARALGERDERLRLAVDGARLGTWALDGTPPVLAASGHFKAHHGRAPEASLLVGDWMAAIHPADREMARAAFARLRAGGGDETIEYRVVTPFGELRWVSAHAHAVAGDPGVPARIVGVTLDVTHRVSAEHALRASEERYALAARATGNVIWDWDPRHDELTWSENLTALYGHGADALASYRTWLDAVHPEDQEGVERTLAEAMDDPQRPQEWSATYRFRRADGTYAAVVDRGYIARDAAGRATRMIGAMEDVTARSELEAQLRQAQKMEALGQLAGGIAHDFNNLLAVIGGNVDFALEDLNGGSASADAVRADLEEVGQAAERARTLVRQLLTFSRRQPVQRRDVRLGEVIASAERLLRRVIGEEIGLEVHVAEPAATVHADPGQLDQILMNLAINARDAMLTPQHGHPGRGGVLSITVDTIAAPEWDADDAPAQGVSGVAPSPSGRWVRLRVSDTGHGMDSETQARIFEPFFTTKEAGAGTGLGLATVFGIVRQNGGDVHVESAPGHGTTFTLLVPAASAPGAVPGAAAPAAPADVPGAVVLLVEDDAALRSTIRRMLERQGHRVLEARDGADALRMWREHGAAVDVLVTDLRMPELGGSDLAARLRAGAPGLAVVYMSGYAAQASAADAAQDVLRETREARAAREALLQKPFTSHELRGAIDRVLGQDRGLAG